MSDQLIPPRERDNLNDRWARQKINGPVGGSTPKRPFAISLVRTWREAVKFTIFSLLFSFILVYIAIHRNQVVEKYDDVMIAAKRLVGINVSGKTDYQLIGEVPAVIQEKYKNDDIYCWEDSKGEIHYSNTGFPEYGEYIPRYVKRR